MATEKVLVFTDSGTVAGYAEIDTAKPLVAADDKSFKLWVTTLDAFVIERSDGKGYKVISEDDVRALLARIGKIDVLLKLGLIDEM